MKQTDTNYRQEREQMITRQIAARGVRDETILEAMRQVPRHAFVPEELRSRAYDDTPLPIGSGQTISQPFVVALMIEALELEGGERILEVGAGSGYAAAVLGQIAGEVHTIERHEALAEQAAARIEELDMDHVHVHHDDGTLGWSDRAPYDAILVSAGGPEIPEPLLDQLAPGGRLLIPVGATQMGQDLIRARRDEDTGAIEREDLGAVRFVPLIGQAGWDDPDDERQHSRARAHGNPGGDQTLSLLEEHAQSFDGGLEDFPIEAFVERARDARVVLLGEASHGTAEFYELRAQITRALVEEAGFDFIALEADWPDAAVVDRWARDKEQPEWAPRPFQRFPTWMWGNEQFAELAGWMRAHNQRVPQSEQVRVHGLDVYSLHNSMGAVLEYLEERDPQLAEQARSYYGCLKPWSREPAAYGGQVWRQHHPGCADEVTQVLGELLENRFELMRQDADSERYLDALQNARVVAGAESYYRKMYEGSVTSWNARDQHMFDTLEALLAAGDEDTQAIVWAHNSHVGDASATEFASRSEFNIGQLCREAFGERAYMVGFGTYTGEVAAASSWGGPMQVKQVRPSIEGSWGELFHELEADQLTLPMRHGSHELRQALSQERLERAIGVIYRPETERQSHYFFAKLAHQFDEYVWLDRTRPIDPIEVEGREDLPAETYPFGL